MANFNVERMKKIRDRIADENTFFDMKVFSISKHVYNREIFAFKEAGIFPENVCETPACVCGWINYEAFHDKEFKYLRESVRYDSYHRACKYLEIDTVSKEGYFLSELFSSTYLDRKTVIIILDCWIKIGRINNPIEARQNYY